MGYLFSEQAETTWVMGVMPIVVGVLMYNASRKARDPASVNGPDPVVVGAAQALAVIAGPARSGTSISAGPFRNLTPPLPGASQFGLIISTERDLSRGMWLSVTGVDPRLPAAKCSFFRPGAKCKSEHGPPRNRDRTATAMLR